MRFPDQKMQRHRHAPRIGAQRLVDVRFSENSDLELKLCQLTPSEQAEQSMTAIHH